MLTEYRMETWDPVRRKYRVAWKGHSQEVAERMMYKPYYRHCTRRLIKTSEEVLYTEKAKKQWSI